MTVTKVCTNCGEEKSIEEFHRDKYMADGRTNRCGACRSRKTGEWNRANPERYAANLKRWQERNPERVKELARVSHVRSYGITWEQYETMLAADCPICKRPMDRPCVDHCHDSDRVRGVICVKCNSGLGMFADSIEVLQSAIDYLKAPPADLVLAVAA